MKSDDSPCDNTPDAVGESTHSTHALAACMYAPLCSTALSTSEHSRSQSLHWGSCCPPLLWSHPPSPHHLRHLLLPWAHTSLRIPHVTAPPLMNCHHPCCHPPPSLQSGSQTPAHTQHSYSISSGAAGVQTAGAHGGGWRSTMGVIDECTA
jgi:hypothetical protein